MSGDRGGLSPVPVAGCISLGELRSRGPVEATPLTFEHLRPAAPVQRATVFRGRGGVWLVSGDRACPVDPAACAPLFAPLTTEAQVRELVTRFERGDVVPEARAAPLLSALAARGLTSTAAAQVPRGGLSVEADADGFVASALLLRTLDGGAEIVAVRLSFTRDGRASRAEEPVVRIAPPADEAPAYEAGAPPPGPAAAGHAGGGPTAHEARLRAFQEVIGDVAPELIR